MTHHVARLLRVTMGTLLAVIMAIGCAFLVPGAAQAQTTPYAPDGAPSLSTSSPAPGTSLSVSGDGFRAGSQVRVVMFSDPVVLGTAKANAAGEAKLEVKIPASFAAGSEHRIEIQGVDSSGEVRVLSQKVTLGGGNGGVLAETGAVLVPVAATGLLLLIVGGALVASGRKPQSTS